MQSVKDLLLGNNDIVDRNWIDHFLMVVDFAVSARIYLLQGSLQYPLGISILMKSINVSLQFFICPYGLAYIFDDGVLPSKIFRLVINDIDDCNRIDHYLVEVK